MMWKKTSVNYSKWDVYTSDSDSDKEEPEPVVPKNDPNFKALEMDINQRKIKREKDSKFAEACKIKVSRRRTGRSADLTDDRSLAGQRSDGERGLQTRCEALLGRTGRVQG